MVWMDGKTKKSDYATLSEYYLATAAACEREAERMKQIGDGHAAIYFLERAQLNFEKAEEFDGIPVRVGQARCGCVYHAEVGIPCKHDIALATR